MVMFCRHLNKYFKKKSGKSIHQPSVAQQSSMLTNVLVQCNNAFVMVGRKYEFR